MLQVTEIFKSIQGESSFTGIPCAFVRLSGCDLGCSYCDSTYAFKDGDNLDIEDILNYVASHHCQLVTITGGEPLLQKECVTLAKALLKEGYTVLVETAGHKDISVLPDACHVIMDIKTPGSEVSEYNCWENINHLDARDEVKFVITDKDDYRWCLDVIKRYDLPKGNKLSFSPAKHVTATELAEWMLEDNINARLNVQLHRVLWPEIERGV